MTNKQQMDKGIDEIQDRYFMYFQDHPVLIPYYIKSGGDNSIYVEKQPAFGTLPDGIRFAIYETFLTWAPHVDYARS
jgi:hypothetical protein